MVFAKRQAAALARLGHTVHMFFLASRTRPTLIWREWRRMRTELREFGPEVVLAEYGTLTALLAALSTTRPLVVTYRGSDLNPDNSITWVRSALGGMMSQLAALRAAGIICVSTELRNRLWWRRDRTVIIPSGADTNVFAPMPRAAARRELGWDDEPVILFHAGSNSRGKRLDLAEATWTKVQQSVPDARLEVMRGSIPPERVPLFMNAADCLLLTSDREGSPTVVPEALACNLPIVAVPVGDVVERLTGAAPSAVVARDPQALAEAVISILRGRRRLDEPAGIRPYDCRVLVSQVVAVLHRAANRL